MIGTTGFEAWERENIPTWEFHLPRLGESDGSLHNSASVLRARIADSALTWSPIYRAWGIGHLPPYKDVPQP